MSREMSKQQIEYIKAKYKPGTRIELTQDMVGENIRASARGTVTGVDSFCTISPEYEKANPAKQTKPRDHNAR